MSSLQPQRISAIVPSYNRAAFLAEALDSILSQTEPPDEVIVVDDGSTDNTSDIVKTFDQRVRYTRIVNSGAPVARSIGASQTFGDWLWFCDSDDLWRPDYLAHVRGLLDCDPRPKFVFGNFRLIVNGDWQSQTKFDTAPAGFWNKEGELSATGGKLVLHPLYRDILAFQPIFHSTLVVARSFYNAVGGYDPQFARTASEDFEFILRCAAHGPAGVVEEALVGIRRHVGNYSANQLRNLLGEIAILRHAKAHHPAARAHESRIDGEIGLRSLQALELAFTEGDHALVRSLSRTLNKNDFSTRLRIKAFLSSLPHPLLVPVLGLIRLGEMGRARPPAVRVP